MVLDGYQTNNNCILDYLALFQALSEESPNDTLCRQMWQDIRSKERTTPEAIPLAPLVLQRRFALNERDFLLAMAALALEMDGGLRNCFRRRYGLQLPTVEYGLQLIAPICPSSCQTLAELSGPNTLCSLLLTTAELTGYPLERPLILCRSAFAFLTGFQVADISGCTLLQTSGEPWIPLHATALAQVSAWWNTGTEHPLSLCGPEGSGRRTLLLQACGPVVLADLPQIAPLSPLDQDHLLREIGVLAKLLDAPVCAQADQSQTVLSSLAHLCRRHGIALAILEDDGGDCTGDEAVHLPRELTWQERERAWQLFVPDILPNALPTGAMTVGALKKVAAHALRLAGTSGRSQVSQDDVRKALLQQGGAMEFGVRYDMHVSLEDMVLPPHILTQLKLICQSAQCGPRLVQWGLPQAKAGVTAVFHGPSGTGKTMAASAIAHELGLPLLQADLSQIMDKYVGETEKHLGRLFQCARENHCVLFFDEADSLFGKRASVSTGHDKYANLSTSYLLQEIEQYDGVALLSTNLLSNFDDAFLRRLQYIVRFALPDSSLREILWRRAIPESRREGDLPFARLAQVELSPARIYAAARGAAVAAMAAGLNKINVALTVSSLQLELEKSGKSLPRELTEYTVPQ